MKLMKKMLVLLLTVTLLVPFVGLQTYAAEGVLMFSDPQTKVGENVSVDLVIQSGGAIIGDVDVKMSYDATSLEFISGNGITNDGNGALTFIHKGNGSETELRTTLEFRALKQGTANIKVTGQTAYLYSDEILTLTEGSSAVTIDVGADGSTSVEPKGEGKETNTALATDVKVEVNGEEYSFSEDFKASDIPDGYGETILVYDGAERKFVENENGVKLGYLVDDSGKAGFFLYNEENATFSPFVEIYISEETAIILMSNVDGVELPEQYQKVDLTVGDYTFPAWQDTGHDGYYAIYALNTTTNQKVLYQYDTVDGTYQRLIVPEMVEKEDVAEDGTILGKVKNFVNNNFMVFLIICAILLLIFIIVLVVLSTKLFHRNAELDDLYDEYGIDDEEIEEEMPSKKANKKSKKKMKKDADEDYLEDGYLEDDYDEDYQDDDFEVDYDEWDDDYEEEFEFEEKPIKSSKRKGTKKDNRDVFDIDFIDL